MDKILVLDFGGQYCHLIARRIRDLGVCSEILNSDIKAEELKKISGIKGIILSGGAASVYDKNSPKYDAAILESGIPILGICYGHQLIAHIKKGEVKSADSGEYGVTDLKALSSNVLFKDLKKEQKVWMNHRDVVKELPREFETVASTKESPIAAFENAKEKL